MDDRLRYLFEGALTRECCKYDYWERSGSKVTQSVPLGAVLHKALMHVCAVYVSYRSCEIQLVSVAQVVIADLLRCYAVTWKDRRNAERRDPSGSSGA